MENRWFWKYPYGWLEEFHLTDWRYNLHVLWFWLCKAGRPF